MCDILTSGSGGFNANGHDMGVGLMQGILEHTLFKGTYFPTWEGLFWEKVRHLPCPFVKVDANFVRVIVL